MWWQLEGTMERGTGKDSERRFLTTFCQFLAVCQYISSYMLLAMAGCEILDHHPAPFQVGKVFDDDFCLIMLRIVSMLTHFSLYMLYCFAQNNFLSILFRTSYFMVFCLRQCLQCLFIYQLLVKIPVPQLFHKIYLSVYGA